MLTILGQAGRYCDGVSRRSFLTIGGLAMGGIALPQLLAAEARTGKPNPHKAIIMVLLPGGPPHLDMYDLKPDAPVEIRGEFKPIATSVPGIDVCELMPRMAATMHKLVFVRSLVGGRNDHNLHQCLTGWESHPQQGDSQIIAGFPAGGWPSIGAAMSKIQGPVNRALPPFLSLAPEQAESTTRASLGQSGYLGLAHSGFQPYRLNPGDMVLKDMGLDRLGDRKALLASLDRFRSEADTRGFMDGMDTFTQQAFGVLTSSKLVEALDFRREDPEVIQRYGIPDEPVPVHGGPKLLEGFLIARRLVQAGARCVTLALSQWPLERESRGGFNWDFHNGNFKKCRANLPMLDHGVTALVEDLERHAMLDDVSIVAWGEFGRTPRINNNEGGRDHWPQVNSCLLAGGGMRTGQVIGSTSRLGEEAKDRPVHYREVFATLYHNVGIDAGNTTLVDLSGRPQYLVDNREPIAELA
jgi:hypothetical protein